MIYSSLLFTDQFNFVSKLWEDIYTQFFIVIKKNIWLHGGQFWWTASVLFRFIYQISVIIMIIDMSR